MLSIPKMGILSDEPSNNRQAAAILGGLGETGLQAVSDDSAEGLGSRPVRGSAGRYAAIGQTLEGAWAGVYELIEDHRGDTYRAVYTVRIADSVHVLHAF